MKLLKWLGPDINEQAVGGLSFLCILTSIFTENVSLIIGSVILFVVYLITKNRVTRPSWYFTLCLIIIMMIAYVVAIIVYFDTGTDLMVLSLLFGILFYFCALVSYCSESVRQRHRVYL